MCAESGATWPKIAGKDRRRGGYRNATRVRGNKSNFTNTTERVRDVCGTRYGR